MSVSHHQLLQVTWRNTKRLVEFLGYAVFDTLVLAGRRPRPDPARAAIVHVELLGDYVLWLPYGLALERYLRAEGREVVLVLNAEVAPLAERHFPEAMVVPVDRRRVVRNWHERRHVLRFLRGLCVGVTYLAAILAEH